MSTDSNCPGPSGRPYLIDVSVLPGYANKLVTRGD